MGRKGDHQSARKVHRVLHLVISTVIASLLARQLSLVKKDAVILGPDLSGHSLS